MIPGKANGNKKKHHVVGLWTHYLGQNAIIARFP